MSEQPTIGIMLNMDGREETPINIKIGGKWHTASAQQIVSALRAQQERENPQPLTLKEILQMDGKPVYAQSGDGFSGWVIVAVARYVDGGHTLYFCAPTFENNFMGEPDEDFINMTHDDPDGHFGLHVLGWRAYANEPKGDNREPHIKSTINPQEPASDGKWILSDEDWEDFLRDAHEPKGEHHE
jgi:hypothetical protein